MRFVLAVLTLVAACGGGSSPAKTDAPTGPDAPPDSPPDAPTACTKIDTAPTNNVPVHVTGSVAGSTLQAPKTGCTQVDAPYGVESVGPDAAFAITGLRAGKSYVVQLAASADLSFYVATGCTGTGGPTALECLLFEDANPGGNEVGRFTATGSTAWVVVDTFASTPPANPAFTLDVYAETCASASDCSATVPACVNGRCVECATSFDCKDASKSLCDATNTCERGNDSCTSDDAAEPGDDGPAGATVLVPDSTGYATRSGQICSSPISEADFIAFDVGSAGETWDFALGWNGNPILHLDLYDATGLLQGASYWEQPQQARLTYLAPGRYYDGHQDRTRDRLLARELHARGAAHARRGLHDQRGLRGELSQPAVSR